jgi:hypothetical protein
MDKETLIKLRTEFFENILEHIQRPPARIDMVLQQDQFFMPVDKEKSFYDASAGDLAICIAGNFYEKEFNVYYSFWQLSDMMRIGVAIYDDELQGAFASDAHNEVFYIWGMKNDPRVDVSHGCVFYDWEFHVPELYQSYQNQEKFILGARHMHFRVMRILHDECHRIFMAKNRNIDEDINRGIDSVEDFETMIKNS